MSYQDLFKNIKTVAIVGLSDKIDRPSYNVAKYLIDQGFKIFPVNPKIKSVFGIKSYKNIADIKQPIDIVDIFRKSEFVEPIVDDAIRVGAKIIWMQEDVVNQPAYDKAHKAGLTVIMDRCIMKTHQTIQI